MALESGCHEAGKEVVGLRQTQQQHTNFCGFQFNALSQLERPINSLDGERQFLGAGPCGRVLNIKLINN